MARALRLLLLLAVVWSGLHLPPAGTEAEARAPVAAPALHHGDAAEAFDHRPPTSSPGGDHQAGHDPSGHHQTCHHHCPVAPDPSPGPALAVPGPTRTTPTAALARRLASLTQPPPVEPPAA